MAHFVRIRALGAWLLATTIEPSELEQLDTNLFKALNADDGGTWAPTNPIIIGGAGMQLQGAPWGLYKANGDPCFVFDPAVPRINVGSGTQIRWDPNTSLFMAVATTAEFFGTATFNGATTIGAGGTLLVQGLSTFTGLATFADAYVAGDVQIGASSATGLLILSTTTFSGPVSFNQPTTVNDPITLGGDGRVRKRVVVGADADTTYGCQNYDLVRIAATSLSANRTYVVSDGNASGDCIRFATWETNYQVELRRQDATSICILKQAATAFYKWVDLVWIGGRWEIDAYHYLATTPN